ncbi:SEC-C metal-binding domain-containing protein [Pullulanibacillus sp. KACC 23026]|uniref:SEC-C metal-binding domain-containing protein n=1 Tax=Pullulanibacillus sp. KACC 23026 TaxID=3028315 RepID=UPI0023AF171B|nr:SEC-C metal-binding domain-containing protein [Pullulanibacillus sp. KACC 23026]WEG14712.1 SEC-C metal-binding domain-containing protein [Pullulanibacillus sp. KACC 23026]
MSNKANINLEEAMNHPLSGLKDLIKAEEEKQQKKEWQAIQIPFSLEDALTNYTKSDCDDIRKRYDIKKASNLKKADLIAVLSERIPEHLENYIQLWDSERFDWLIKIAANDGQLLAPGLTDGQIDYFRSTGLIYTGIYEGKKIAVVPQDVIESIKALKTNIKLRAAIKKNTEWIKLARGLLYYYGTLDTEQLVGFLESYMKKKVPFDDFQKVLEEANRFKREHTYSEEGFSNIRVLDPARIKREQQVRTTIPYYPFSKHQLLVAGESGFIDRNRSFVQFTQFLIGNFQVDHHKAVELVDECVFLTKIGETPNLILQFLSQQLESISTEALQALMKQVVSFMNNTREWFLKGYTSEEVAAQEKENQRHLTMASNRSSQTVKVVKVGRNDPCPCGSGSKYKKCCGR